jgi:hypothetical protein
MKKRIRTCLYNIFGAALIMVLITGCNKDNPTDSESSVPILTTLSVDNITSTSATSGGNISNDGGSAVTERGVCWSTSPNPTVSHKYATDGSSGTGKFSSNLSGLTGNTSYYVRAYAKNITGTGYGEVISFSTSPTTEFAAALQATNVKSTVAVLNGRIRANYLTTSATFEYGTSLNYGEEIAATPDQITGNSFTDISANIDGLTPQTTYHYRIKIVNSSGTAYSNDMTFYTNYVLGEFYQGGIIFYYDSTGQHGLVVAPIDQSAGAEWGCFGVDIPGADNQEIGTGQQNTIDILAGCPTPGIAARICADLVLNGYSDWFLPSDKECILMVSYLPEGFYWSSTEMGPHQAYFNPSYWYYTAHNKNNIYKVRAVRAF